MHVVILVTAGSAKEAQRIAANLIKNKLAACVNIISGMQSVFWWEGKADKAKESLLVIKSKRSLLPKIIKAVRAVHSYEVPEIIALPIVGGERKYLRWIDDSIGKSR
jgi:periplasmic divalent cation tolerance protein